MQLRLSSFQVATSLEAHGLSNHKLQLPDLQGREDHGQQAPRQGAHSRLQKGSFNGDIDTDRYRYTTDSKKLQHGPGTIHVGFPSSLRFGVGGQSYS